MGGEKPEDSSEKTPQHCSGAASKGDLLGEIETFYRPIFWKWSVNKDPIGHPAKYTIYKKTQMKSVDNPKVNKILTQLGTLSTETQPWQMP